MYCWGLSFGFWNLWSYMSEKTQTTCHDQRLSSVALVFKPTDSTCEESSCLQGVGAQACFKERRSTITQGQPLSCGFFCNGIAWLPVNDNHHASRILTDAYRLSRKRHLPEHLHLLAPSDSSIGQSVWQATVCPPLAVLSSLPKNDPPRLWTCHKEIRSSVPPPGREVQQWRFLFKRK